MELKCIGEKCDHYFDGFCLVLSEDFYLGLYYETMDCIIDIEIDYTEHKLKSLKNKKEKIEQQNKYNYCKEMIDSWPEWKKEIARKNYDYKD